MSEKPKVAGEGLPPWVATLTVVTAAAFGITLGIYLAGGIQ